MAKNYCVVTKSHGLNGRIVLQSFAQTPIKKSFESMVRQNDTTPGYWTKIIAGKALKKYCTADWEVKELSIIQAEIESYKSKRHELTSGI